LQNTERLLISGVYVITIFKPTLT